MKVQRITKAGAPAPRERMLDRSSACVRPSGGVPHGRDGAALSDGRIADGVQNSKSTAGTLSERVVSYLSDYTRRNRLPCGSEIPSEGTLSTELKVSRGVVREAYRSLKTAGIIDFGNGR